MKTNQISQIYKECAKCYGEYGEYALTQLPYLGRGYFDGYEQCCYVAAAIDAEEKDCELRWQIKDEWDGYDESDACNWEEFVVKTWL